MNKLYSFYAYDRAPEMFSDPKELVDIRAKVVTVELPDSNLADLIAQRRDKFIMDKAVTPNTLYVTYEAYKCLCNIAESYSSDGGDYGVCFPETVYGMKIEIIPYNLTNEGLIDVVVADVESAKQAFKNMAVQRVKEHKLP